MSVYKNDRLSWVNYFKYYRGTVLPGEILIYCDGKVDVSVYNLLLKFKKELPKNFHSTNPISIRAELFQAIHVRY